MLNNEELISNFRESYEELPDELKRREVDRLYSLVHGRKIIILEDPESGKVIKFLDIKNLIEYFNTYKHIKADRSFIYKVLRGQYSSAYGFSIYYEEDK